MSKRPEEIQILTLLAIPQNKRGKVLSEDVTHKVMQFYENEEFGRMCPGKKDFVPITIDGKKVQKIQQFERNVY